VWDEHLDEVRWMCSFNSSEEDIKGFIQEIKTLLQVVS
jgi:threonine aldolase